jgi:threonine/homoserine/homoserine lactone efflux protein
MTSIDTAIAFFGLSLVLGFTPGPDNLFVLVQSATRGRTAGLCVLLGLCTGLILHTAAVALGLAAVFAASAAAFTVLKFVGSAYLAFLAWQAFRAPARESASVDVQQSDLLRMYARGVIMNLTNPKVVFFFLAFLPQFVKPELGSVALQLCWFGFLFILATLVAFGAITYFAASIGQRLQRSAKAQRLLSRVAGLVFVGLAARLALSER